MDTMYKNTRSVIHSYSFLNPLSPIHSPGHLLIASNIFRQAYVVSRSRVEMSSVPRTRGSSHSLGKLTHIPAMLGDGGAALELQQVFEMPVESHCTVMFELQSASWGA